MLIRYATIGDTDQLSALFRQDAEQHQDRARYYRLRSNYDWKAFIMHRMDGRKGRILVADHHGVLAGFIMIRTVDYPSPEGRSVIQRIRRSPGEPPPAPMEPLRLGIIEQCFVPSTQRRQGTGKQLVEAALGWFKVKKIRRVELSVDVRNQAAEHFWRSMGFEPFRLSCARDI